MKNTYCAGLFRTGTNSIYEMFRRSFRAEHEFMMDETLGAFCARTRGEMAPQEFTEFLMRREDAGGLDMDSAGYHYLYMDVITRELPDSRVILTIRDCYSWMNSFIKLIVTYYAERGPLLIEALNCVDHLPDSRYVWSDRQNRKVSLEQLMRIWSFGNRNVLAGVPADRLLVIRLRDLKHSMGRIAEFVGAPLSSLDYDHANRTVEPTNYLAGFDLGRLEELFDRHCSVLMQEMFPGTDLRSWMKRVESFPAADADQVGNLFSFDWELRR